MARTRVGTKVSANKIIIENVNGEPPDDHSISGSFLGKYYTRLRIGKYQRPTPFDTPKFENSTIVFLPLPTELRDDTSVSYTTPNLESVGDLLNGGLGGIDAAIESALLRYAGNAILGGADLGARGLGALLGAKYGANAQAATKAITGGIGKIGSTLFSAEQITSGIQQSLGVAPNPNPSVAFQGPNLRDFSYTWALYPNNKEESLAIQKLIKLLKRKALPSNVINNSAALLTYPDMCQVNFFPWDKGGNEETWGWSDNSIIRFKKCFMQSVNVNYSPFGTPAFFEGTELPVTLQLTIAFREIEYMLSNDWAEDLTKGMTDAKTGKRDAYLDQAVEAAAQNAAIGALFAVPLLGSTVVSTLAIYDQLTGN